MIFAKNIDKMAIISKQLDQSLEDADSIDSDRFRSINQIFSQIKDSPRSTLRTAIKRRVNQQGTGWPSRQDVISVSQNVQKGQQVVKKSKITLRV